MFAKSFENAVRDYFKKMFVLIRKQHINFRKLVRKFFCKIALANTTCFLYVLANLCESTTNE